MAIPQEVRKPRSSADPMGRIGKPEESRTGVYFSSEGGLLNWPHRDQRRPSTCSTHGLGVPQGSRTAGSRRVCGGEARQSACRGAQHATGKTEPRHGRSHSRADAANLRRCLIVARRRVLPAARASSRARAGGAIRQSCRGTSAILRGGSPGGQAALACRQQNRSVQRPVPERAARGERERRASRRRNAMQASPATGPAATPRSPAARATDATQWPHTLTGDAGSAVVYQPQVISWPEHQTLNARVAVGITPTGATAPVLGTIDVAFSTQTDLAARSVALYDARLTSSRFPSADTGQASKFEERIKAALAAMGPKRYPLDTVLMSLPQPTANAAEVAVRTTARIFVSDRPASLVVFDGEPVLAPVAGTALSLPSTPTGKCSSTPAARRGTCSTTAAGWRRRRLPDRGPGLEAAGGIRRVAERREFRRRAQGDPGARHRRRDAPEVFVATSRPRSS